MTQTEYSYDTVAHATKVNNLDSRSLFWTVFWAVMLSNGIFTVGFFLLMR